MPVTYLNIDTYYYFISISDEFIHLFIVFKCLLKISRSIENIRHCIKRHIVSLEQCVSCKLFTKYFQPTHHILLNNFIKMVDVTGFVNRLCLFDVNVL